MGKTHLAVALGPKAIEAGYRVLVTTGANLIATLTKAHAEGRLDEKLKFYTTPRLLIIDEIGYLPIERLGANLFFQLISRRYERGPMILTSNQSFGAWGEVFDDRIIATAILDRLLHLVREHAARGHVRHSGEADKAPCHGNVGRVQRPDLVGMGDRELAEQVWLNLVTWRGFARARLRRQGFNAHMKHQRSDVEPPSLDALPGQLVAQHARPHERMFQVQFVDFAHQRQIGRADRLGQVVDRPPADVEQAGLTCDAKFVVTVDHGFALRNPALVSALSKKSFSSASWPILACSGARFTGSDRGPASKTSAARSSNCRSHSVIWFGCSSNCSHSSARVLSARRAARATRALNVELWVRRVRCPDAFFFTIRNSFLPDRIRSGLIPRVSTYSAVQIVGATSPISYLCIRVRVNWAQLQMALDQVGDLE